MNRDCLGLLVNPDGKHLNCIFLGDSITKNGSWEGEGDGFAYICANDLYDKHRYQCSIIGYGGYDVKKLCTEIVNEKILAKDYDVIFCEVGTNDWNFGTPLTDFRHQYEELVKMLTKNTKAKIACISLGWFHDWTSPVRNPVKEAEYNFIIKSIAATYHIGYIDMLHAMTKSGMSFEEMTYEPDRVHPSPTGSRIWAKAVLSYLMNK
jgi:lysophospholipase L1-like esterase